MEPQERGEATLAREQLDEVTGALEALTAALDDNGALDAALQLVCRQVVQVLPGADMASVTLVRNGKPETAACSDGYVLDIDTDQYRAVPAGRHDRQDGARRHRDGPPDRVVELLSQAGLVVTPG
jgi:hypothetical protein